MVSFNYGLASVIAVLKEAGHKVKLFIVDDYSGIRRIIKDILDFNSDVIGFSCMSNYWQYTKELSKKIKSTPALKNIPILAGGPHAIVCPSSIKESAHIDGLCIGEGEHAFLEVVNKIAQGKDFKDTSNFYFNSKEGVIKNELRMLIGDLDGLPFPDRDVFPDKVFTSYANFTLSRGCPYSCSYCCNSAFHKIFKDKGSKIRHRSVSKALEEIELFVKRYKPAVLSFDDDCFNKNPGWFKSFCSEYRERIGIPYTCNTRPELLDSESAKLLKESGCKKINIGIESGDEHLRRSVLNRNIKDEQIIRAFGYARENGLETMSFNILGFPGETRQSIRKTIDLNKRIRPDYAQVSIFYPYAGTPLGELCKEKKYLRSNKYQFTYFGEGSSVLELPGISKSDIKDAYLRFDLELCSNGNNFKKAYRMKKIKNSAHSLYRKLPLSLKNILRAIKRRRAS